ncbi:hypothetical protein D3C86_1563610 [compost metagenome]
MLVHHCSALPRELVRHATLKLPGARTSTVSRASSTPLSIWGAAIGAGSQPQPRPRICASSLSRMVGTTRTSCPASTPCVRAGRLREVSPTATMRCLAICIVVSGPSSVASGWCEATANTNGTDPSGRTWKPCVLGAS